MDDGDIITLFQQRSEEAIRELSEKYGGLCMDMAYRVVNDRLDAQECVNDAYLRVWNSIPPQYPESLPAYLLKIVRNLAINLQNGKKTLKRRGNYELCLDELSDVVASPQTVDTHLEAEVLTSLLNHFLDELDTQNRGLFMGRYWHMKSYAELAAETGLSQGTIRTRLSRLRAKLKRELSKEEIIV